MWINIDVACIYICCVGICVVPISAVHDITILVLFTVLYCTIKSIFPTYSWKVVNIERNDTNVCMCVCILLKASAFLQLSEAFK